MQDRAETLTGANKSVAATATEITILLSVSLCDSTDSAARRIVTIQILEGHAPSCPKHLARQPIPLPIPWKFSGGL